MAFVWYCDMILKHKIDLKSLILTLLYEKEKVSLQDIAHEAGLVADSPAARRAIQRALTCLIEQQAIEAQGQARSRFYILPKKTNALTPDKTMEAFKHILLSEESVELLHLISKPIQMKKPVGYNQDFLKSYRPNRTFYLNHVLREKLFILGNAEPVVRPAGTYARTILSRLLIDLSWNSSRLEGNTYSLLETKRLIELGENASGKNAADAQMILNHKDAIEYMTESTNETTISSHEVCSIHALLSENLLGDPSASGRLRDIAVGISGTTYLPLENAHVLKECFDIFIKKLNRIEDPFEQSFFALVHLSYMQAFEDVNKRTARLVANIPLIMKNLKPLSFIDVIQNEYVMSLLGVYEKNDVSLLRDLYVWAYTRSSQRYSAMQQAMGEPNVFKMKYRREIQDIVRALILEKIIGSQVVPTVKNKVKALALSDVHSTQLVHVIETEIVSLHDGNIARFKIRPSEFEAWRCAQ